MKIYCSIYKHNLIKAEQTVFICIYKPFLQDITIGHRPL